MLRVLLAIVLKEIRQLRRDRRMIPMLLAAPLIQVLVFGFAANLDVDHVPLLLVDRDRSAASRALVDRFLASGKFDLVGVAEEVGEIDAWLVGGRAQLALVVGADYAKAIAAGRAPEVQVIADGSDSTSAVVGLGYASQIVAAAGGEILRERIGARVRAATLAGRPLELPQPGRVELVPRVWYNPDLKSRWFYLPAICAMVLLMTTMILPSMAVVREKEIGTLEQLIVSPIRPWQLIVGKLWPFAVIGVLNLAFLAAVIVGFFRAPLAGSFGTLLLLTLPFLATMLGLGLLVSTLVDNQQQAMMTAMFLVMVPMIYLSGLIFPIENMPEPMQLLTYGIPLRYYAVILRGVFLKGSGLDVLWVEGLVLCGFALGTITLAARRFHKSLD